MNCNLLATYKHFYFLKKKINIDFKLQIFLLFVVKLLYMGVHLICGIIQVFRIFSTFDHNNRFWVLFLHFKKSSLYLLNSATYKPQLFTNSNKNLPHYVMPTVNHAKINLIVQFNLDKHFFYRHSVFFGSTSVCF